MQLRLYAQAPHENDHGQENEQADNEQDTPHPRPPSALHIQEYESAVTSFGHAAHSSDDVSKVASSLRQQFSANFTLAPFYILL